MYRQALKVNYPIFQEKLYEKELLFFTKTITRLIKEDIYIFLNSNDEYKSLRNDDFNGDFKRFIEFLGWKILPELKKILSKLTATSIRINEFNKKSFTNSLNKIQSIQINTIAIKNIHIDTELKMWITENTRLIKTIPSNLLGKVEELVFNSIRVGHSYKTLAKHLKLAFNISENRAKVIARDQISKLNGNLTRQRNLSLGITKYKWLSSRDERVRHSHKVLEGKICSWQDASIYKNNEVEKWQKRSSLKGVELHPAQDILCRCTSTAIISGLL